MNELATFPTSIRQRLEEARTLVSQNRPRDADALVSQVLNELARTRPELCAVVLASRYGYRELVWREKETTTYWRPVTKTFLGLEVGKDYEPHTTVRTVEKRWSLE